MSQVCSENSDLVQIWFKVSNSKFQYHSWFIIFAYNSSVLIYLQFLVHVKLRLLPPQDLTSFMQSLLYNPIPSIFYLGYLGQSVLWTSGNNKNWEFVRNTELVSQPPDLKNQNLWEGHPETCILTSSSENFYSHQSFRHTLLGYLVIFQINLRISMM